MNSQFSLTDIAYCGLPAWLEEQARRVDEGYCFARQIEEEVSQ